MIEILNFTGMYDEYDLKAFEKYGFLIKDMKSITGTKLYVDDEGEKAVKEKISPVGERLFHLIDTGDYHYITRLYLYDLKEPFDLLVFDHHDDCKEPEFEGVRSCGSWIKDAITDIPGNLAGIRLIKGTDEDVFLKGSFDEKRPLYVSIDKDVLDKDICPTNWDQGEMSLEELLKTLKNMTSGRKLYGVDICGGPAKDAVFNGNDIKKNQAADMAIIGLLCYSNL